MVAASASPLLLLQATHLSKLHVIPYQKHATTLGELEVRLAAHDCQMYNHRRHHHSASYSRHPRFHSRPEFVQALQSAKGVLTSWAVVFSNLAHRSRRQVKDAVRGFSIFPAVRRPDVCC